MVESSERVDELVGQLRNVEEALRDLAYDLDQVAVGIEDAQLPIRAVAVAEEVIDPLELSLRAELACVRLELPQPPADELRHGHPIAAPGGEVHDRRLEPVAGSQPLVLARQDPVVRANLLTLVEAF